MFSFLCLPAGAEDVEAVDHNALVHLDRLDVSLVHSLLLAVHY